MPFPRLSCPLTPKRKAGETETLALEGVHPTYVQISVALFLTSEPLLFRLRVCFCFVLTTRVAGMCPGEHAVLFPSVHCSVPSLRALLSWHRRSGEELAPGGGPQHLLGAAALCPALSPLYSPLLGKRQVWAGGRRRRLPQHRPEAPRRGQGLQIKEPGNSKPTISKGATCDPVRRRRC